MGTLPHVGSKLDGPNGAASIHLVEFIGGGAFGFVFRAEDLVVPAKYAVKIPQVGVFGGKTELDAFNNEVMAATKVHHPNIVRVLFVNTQVPYLVLEFVEGGTLKERLDRLRADNKQVSLDVLKPWLQQLVAGMKAINDVVLHRDIKPDNILVAADGSLRISDFGLAKLVGAATRSNTFKGGQHMLYMAPEGWQQDTNTIQTDMYAAGITMFEMCTLSFPYTVSADTRDLQRMHLFELPKRLRELRPELSASLEQVLVRMMAKRAADRFKTWDDIARAIDAGFAARTSSGSSPDVQAILSAATSAHQARVAAAAAEQKRQQQTEQRRNIHLLQREALLEMFRPVVNEFNEHSQLGKASIRENGQEVTFAFPHLSIAVRFYDFGERKIPLREYDRREIHFFARVQNDNRQGFNAVLVHSGPDDMYGEWQGWEIGIWGLARQPIHGRTHGDRFGFNDEEFYDEFQYSNGTTHVYTYRRVDDMAARFAELAREPRR